MASLRRITLPCVESTNTWARLNLDPADTEPVVVTALSQTAGRGQRGNSWESAPGLNLTFTLALCPRWMAPARQFELSMLVSLGILEGLQHFLPARRLTVKWPNDIYFDDLKLAGILIENTVTPSRIEQSLIGIGLNVNQLHFTGDAPNPVSMAAVTGHSLDLDTVLDTVTAAILDNLEQYAADPEPDELSALYNASLWRRDGRPHLWTDTLRGCTFSGILQGAATDGVLTVIDCASQTPGHYLFKEIRAVL